MSGIFRSAVLSADLVASQAAQDAALAGDAGAARIGTKLAAAGATRRRLDQKAAERISATDFDLVTLDPAVNSQAGLEAAIAAADGELWLPPGEIGVNTDPANPRGVRLRGPGRVLQRVSAPIAGYPQIAEQTYVHDLGPHQGRGYLYRVHQRLKSGVGTLTGFLHGDSTVIGGNGESTPFRPEVFFSKALQRKGLMLPVNITNNGVAGTKITDLDTATVIATELAPTTDFLALKFGINDGSIDWNTRLLTYANAYDAKLQAIRGATYGDVAQLAIILMAPSATWDPPSGRDPRWYEQLRNVHLHLARKWRCFFFDTYALEPDVRNAARLWMDDPFGDGLRPIHPTDLGNAYIWGALADAVFPTDQIHPFRSNHFTNLGAADGVALPGTLATAWDFGTHWRRALVSDGWPIDGHVITERNRDGSTLQRLVNYAPNSTRCLMRTFDLVNGTWNPWTGVNVASAYGGAWAWYGAGWPQPGSTLSESGLVVHEGAIKNGSGAPGSLLATVPAGRRPASNITRVVNTGFSGALGVIQIAPSGDITAFSAVDPAYVSLGCTWQAA